jgi:hypothetical protein
MKTITRKPLTEDQIFEMEYRAEQARERAQKKAKTGKKNGFKVEVYKPSADLRSGIVKPVQAPVAPNNTWEEVFGLPDPWDMVCVHIVDNRDHHAENVKGFWQDKFQLALPPATQVCASEALVDVTPLVEVPAKAKARRAPKTTRVVSKNQEVFVQPVVVDLDPTVDLVKYVKAQARKENTIARIKEKAGGEFADSYGIYPEPGTEIKKANRKVRDTLAAQKRKVTKPVDAQKGDYKKLQSGNSVFFKSLNKADQAYLRAQGYNNVGWDKVLKSAKLIEQFKLG